VIVVDDGSQDDPAAVTRRWDNVELISQPNAGLAAARNAGLRAVRTEYVLFLDADDILAPDAVEQQLLCFSDHPGCGFVYGRHRRVDVSLKTLEVPRQFDCAETPYHAFLKSNFIGMHAAVLYDAAKLIECGGFDPRLRRCEDYDAYFRVVRKYPVASHEGIVAGYRIHADNMSADAVEMLDWTLSVQERHRPDSADSQGAAAFREGRRLAHLAYANAAWRDRSRGAWRRRWAMTRRSPLHSLAAALWRPVRPYMPAPVVRAVRRLTGHRAPAVGAVDMGDLARLTPISLGWGDDRGTPIDRWYIEGFLERHAGDVKGRVLEIAEADYCRRFDHGITRQDILHVTDDNPDATIIGDMSQPGVLPDDAFDCMIITQTLHLIYDMPAAIAQLKRALAPGGVLLLTVPGVSSVCRGEWNECWYWSLTGQSAKLLFEKEFGAGNVEVTVGGNVYSSTCFLHGLAVEEVDQRMLEKDDFAYPLVVCVRARRRD
jgi:SAM-dependent methyltransferase